MHQYMLAVRRGKCMKENDCLVEEYPCKTRGKKLRNKVCLRRTRSIADNAASPLVDGAMRKHLSDKDDGDEIRARAARPTPPWEISLHPEWLRVITSRTSCSELHLGTRRLRRPLSCLFFPSSIAASRASCSTDFRALSPACTSIKSSGNFTPRRRSNTHQSLQLSPSRRCDIIADGAAC